MVAKTVPQLVVEAARALYGEQWRFHISQILDLNPRTVRKYGRAAMTGEPHPVSPGVLLELAVVARERAAALEYRSTGGRGRAQCLEMIAVELDEAARVWTSTRRPRKN